MQEIGVVDDIKFQYFSSKTVKSERYQHVLGSARLGHNGLQVRHIDGGIYLGCQMIGQDTRVGELPTTEIVYEQDSNSRVRASAVTISVSSLDLAALGNRIPLETSDAAVSHAQGASCDDFGESLNSAFARQQL